MAETDGDPAASEADAVARDEDPAFAAIRLRAQRRQRAIELAIELGLAPQAAEAAIDRAMIDQLPDLDEAVQNYPLLPN
ncbi:MAG: hypothetical protein QOH23_1425 [Gaiellaceae bacterium]|jgi:hypothetical protein|nr:hypothetical protein [Gaiellaceae bacterium]